MSSLYTEIIQDAYRRPVHRGELPDASHSFQDENPLCGDTLAVHVRVEDGRLAEAKFTGRGCAISQAAAELLLDEMEGRPVSEIESLTKDDVLDLLGIPTISPARLKCALLALKVLKGAVYGMERA